GVAHHVAADDRAVPLLVSGSEHRRLAAGLRLGAGPVVGRVAGVQLLEPLVRAPAVVLSALLAAPREVDLLPVVLADVPDHEVAGLPVEREAVGVAEPEG